ncbi:unnamed protein product [Amoebophrya sp. A120]|nr:unnamed protein product [Amoebophrya sp. A120]|eukprot:GSA120T00009113001.1
MELPADVPVAESAEDLTERTLQKAEETGNEALITGELETAITAFRHALEHCEKLQKLHQRVKTAEGADDVEVVPAPASTTSQDKDQDRGCAENEDASTALTSKSTIQQMKEKKTTILIALANAQLQNGQSYSAWKTAGQAVLNCTRNQSTSEVQKAYLSEARLVRARAITYMERRDEQYYDEESERKRLMAEAVADLQSVLAHEPSNQAAKNELEFLNTKLLPPGGRKKQNEQPGTTTLRGRGGTTATRNSTRNSGRLARSASSHDNSFAQSQLRKYTHPEDSENAMYYDNNYSTSENQNVSDHFMDAMRKKVDSSRRMRGTTTGINADAAASAAASQSNKPSYSNTNKQKISTTVTRSPSMSGRFNFGSTTSQTMTKANKGTAGSKNSSSTSSSAIAPTELQANTGTTSSPDTKKSQYQKAVQLAKTSMESQASNRESLLLAAQLNSTSSREQPGAGLVVEQNGHPSQGMSSLGGTSTPAAPGIKGGQGLHLSGAVVGGSTSTAAINVTTSNPNTTRPSKTRPASSGTYFSKRTTSRRQEKGEEQKNGGDQEILHIADYVRHKSSLLRPQSSSLGKSRSEAVLGQLALANRRPFC